MSDWQKQEWQREEAARNAALDTQREREKKARERSARNARRKLERLHRTLKESGDITDFEDEFSESVSERLDAFGSAFANPELGRPGDALSASQKRVLSAMNRKVKEAKKRARQIADGETPDTEDAQDRSRSSFRRSSFRSKSKYTPRVRQLDEDFAEDTAPISRKALRAVVAPDIDDSPETTSVPGLAPEPAEEPTRPPVGRPFLRIVKSDE